MAPLPLTAAVGIRNGKTQAANRAKDQVQIIDMLMSISVANGGRKEVWTLSPLVSERICGPDLYKGINDFQIFWRSRGEFRVVDGVVDPAGTTYRKMYALAGQFPPLPNGPDEPVVPPSGVAPTPQDFASILFEPPLYVGLGIKVSAADPYIVGTITAVLGNLGIQVPHGCDILLAGLKPVRVPKPVDKLPFTGVLLGVTPRNGAASAWTLDKAISFAKANGADPQVIAAVEKIAKSFDNLPSSMALAGGVTAVMAKGFQNVGQMNGYMSTGGDETAFNVAIGGNFKGFIKWVMKGAEIYNLGTQGWAMIDVARKLAADKSKALAPIDIPGLSIGVDVGISKGTTRWYALDIARLVAGLPGLSGG